MLVVDPPFQVTYRDRDRDRDEDKEGIGTDSRRHSVIFYNDSL